MFGMVPPKPPDPEPPSSEPPIPYDDVKALFEWLDRPNPPPCDHSHRQTIEFLRSRGLAIEPTLAWLRANGGGCDCEVIFNVTNDWGEVVGWQPHDEDAAPAHLCPKCNTAMDMGALRASRRAQGLLGTNRIRWVGKDGDAFRIHAYRCPWCGHIELSATERPGT